MKNILLVSMPLGDPRMPNLAIEQLAAASRARLQPCDVLYGTTLLSPSVPLRILHSLPGQGIFSPWYFSHLNPESFAAELVDSIIQSYPEVEDQRTSLMMEYWMGTDAAGECLRRCLDLVPVGKYDIVGFSLTFDAQKLASACFAKLLKSREGGLAVIFGGSACDAPMGRAMLETFPEIDFIVEGDGDEVFPAIVNAIRSGDAAPALANCLYRTSSGIQRSAEAPQAVHPVWDARLDYATYIEQFRASYPDEKLVLMFEASRGCWWGAKHHCKFCGVHKRFMPFRPGSAETALERIVDLQREYNPHTLYATDLILDLKQFRPALESLRSLREQGELQGLKLFFEIKTNMKREQVALLASAGVKYVQPGIESFSSNILNLVDKGCLGIQQVELLKWLRTYEIVPIYSILTAIPFETARDYDVVTALSQCIRHLPPPMNVNRLVLHKFSPYAQDPAAYGINNVRPFEFDHLIYQTPDPVKLADLVYTQRYDSQLSVDTLAACDTLVAAVTRWRECHEAGEGLWSDDVEGGQELWREYDKRILDKWRLTGLQARVYAACQHAASLGAIAREVRRDPREVEGILNELCAESLVLHMDERYLALAVPSKPDNKLPFTVIEDLVLLNAD